MTRTLRLAALLLLAVGIAAVVLLSIPPVPATADPPLNRSESAVDAKIQIVWPHDSSGRYREVAQAPLANAEVYLFKRGTKEPVRCDFDAPVILRWAENRAGLTTLIPAHDDSIATRHMVGKKTMRVDGGVKFPVWVFNDIDVRQAMFNAHNQYYFFVEVQGVDYRTNVWAHGSDPRTHLPNIQQVRTSYGDRLTAANAFIEIVWPKDETGQNQPVRRAPLANISVRLTQYGENRRGPASDAELDVQLLKALNDGYLIRDTQNTTIRREGALRLDGSAEPWWDFNDVNVSAAQDPENRMFFAVQIPGLPVYTTIWAHGADSRTYFPARDIPSASCAE